VPSELIWEDRGVLHRYWDVVTGDELVQSNHNLYSDPKFKSIEYALAIFSKSVVLKASSTEVRLVAKSDAEASKRNPKLVIAIVGNQAVIRGLANLYRLQYEAIGGPWKVQYFETEEAARRWLSEMLD